jgi:hypothetical protein
MAGPIGGTINQVTQLGVETAEGVIVPAIRRLGALGINMSPTMNVGKQRPRGAKYASGHPINQEYSEGGIEGSAAYNEIAYALASIYSKPVFTDLGGAFAAREYAVGELVEGGTTYWRVTTGGTATTEPVWAGGAGTTAASGPVVFTNTGVLVAGNPINQLAFETQTYAKDDIQTYTLEAIDTQRGRAKRMSNAAFTELTLESTRADEMTVGGTVIGKLMERGITPTTAGLVQERPVYADPSHVNVYLNDSHQQLGQSKLEANFGYNYSFSDRFSQAWVHDRSQPSWKQLLESEPSLTLELTLSDDDVGDSILSDAKKGDRSFVRFEALGPEIYPGSGVFYAAVIDTCMQVSDSPSEDDADDAYVVTLPMEAEHDEAWGKATRCLLTNRMAAL